MQTHWRALLQSPRVAFACVLTALGCLKVWLSYHAISFGIDGGLYVEVAQHVRDGEGLVSNLSLYHQGYPYFPHPTSLYPMWPLLLGAAAKVIPITTAAVGLPSLFYVATLVVVYLWANALWPHAKNLLGVKALNAGLVMVLMFGLNRAFFEFTSQPYTEGLGMFLVAACFWCGVRWLETPTFSRGLVMGLLCSAAFLTRSQLIVLPMAMLLTLCVGGVFRRVERTHYVKMLAGFVPALLLPTSWHIRYVSGFVPNADVGSYINFESAQVSSALSPFLPYVPTEGVVDYLLDRLGGVMVSLSPVDAEGYATIAYTFVYAIPLALVAGAPALWRERRAFVERLKNADIPGGWLPWVLAIAFATGAVVSLHSVHKAYLSEWPFARRHAIPAVFAMGLCWIWAARSALRPVRLLAGLLLIAGVGMGISATSRVCKKVRTASRIESPLAAARASLVEWINAERSRRGKLTLAVADNEAQRFAYQTPGVGYHWIHTATTAADMSTLVKQFGIDAAIVRSDTEDRAEKGALGAPADLGPDLTPSSFDLQGYRVYVPASP